MPEERFVTAVNRRGEKQRVPATWLTPGHRFADQFKLPPSARAAGKSTKKADTTTTTPPGGDK